MGLKAPGAPHPEARRWIGPVCAVAGVLGFSFKAILIKLAYAWSDVDATTLLALRMLYSAPFFAVLAWWAGRGARPIAPADWKRLVWLGFIGYYLASLLDFVGLKYISAALERLVLYLYPTLVILLSAIVLRRPVTRRAGVALALSYAGIVLAFRHDLNVSGDAAALAKGGGLVFAGAFCYALYLVGAGSVIARLGTSRFIAWAMLISSAFVFAQFALTRPAAALAVPVSVQALSFAMAIFSTVLPTWLVAEAIRRLGANATSLVGSLGPIFTIGFGALILGESTHLLQLVGAALVLTGVLLVSLKPGAASSVRPSDERREGL